MKMALSVIAGFILGAGLFHTPAVSGQVPTSLRLTITPVSMSGTNFSATSVLGTFVGFSCVADKGNPGDGVCYVASR